ncbi:DUF6692 family protein [Histidinibacterium lentulum]|uniref:DUF305 domain-containing protein n=1 Tax=Histidinibacterium lentulum TaxID=2480588 RepID=A0A3N2R523_9RHOB|nr:DUF6692 family protein [Histidinibacterium lentulum]ROU02446.1 DUF305 domain-containing protein [Histidinibacterium lentulum]
MSYWRFAAMIATSTVVMFILMYLNTYALEHLFWSETRVYMAILMGAAMAVIMLGYMLSMYASTAINAVIFGGAIVVFGLSLWLVRSQATVQDRAFMSAMIPHHSIAIMTSTRAELTDARVEKLAREIVLAQNREIAEMRYLLADIGASGETAEIYEDPPAEVGTLEEALNATLRATLDPAPLAPRDMPAALSADAYGCGFRRVEGEDPVLWTGDGGGLIRLNGVIIPLDASGGSTWSAPGVTMTLRQTDGAGWRGSADLIFTLDQGPTVGYRGFYECGL